MSDRAVSSPAVQKHVPPLFGLSVTRNWRWRCETIGQERLREENYV